MQALQSSIICSREFCWRDAFIEMDGLANQTRSVVGVSHHAGHWKAQRTLVGGKV